MKIWILILPILLMLNGCSIIKMEQPHYKDGGDPLQKKEMSFKSKQALAKGGTINNNVANKVFYEGTEAKSPEAKILLDFSYDVMGVFGVNRDFDFNDPEAMKKAQDEIMAAVEEKNQIIAKLEEDVKKKQLKNDQIVRDKKAELEAESGKWKWRMGSGLIGMIILFVLLLIAAGVAQAYTGVPFLKGLLGGMFGLFGLFKSGLQEVHKSSVQQIKAIQKVRDELTHEIGNGGTPEQKEVARKWLGKLDRHLGEQQDEDVKKYIVKQKEFLHKKKEL